MFTSILTNKWVMVGVVIMALLLGWIGYSAYKEYETLSEKCARVNGTLVYDNETGRMYCNVPRPRSSSPSSWWPW